MNIFIYTPTIDTLPPHQHPSEAKEDEDAPEDSHPLFGTLPHLCIRQLMCESVHWKKRKKHTADDLNWIVIVGFRSLPCLHAHLEGKVVGSHSVENS